MLGEQRCEEATHQLQLKAYALFLWRGRKSCYKQNQCEKKMFDTMIRGDIEITDFGNSM